MEIYVSWIGFKVETLDSDKAESFGLKGTKGVFVTAIHDLSPATEGLQQGDVISAVDGKLIESKDGFDLKMLEMKPDQELNLTIHRKGKN